MNADLKSRFCRKRHLDPFQEEGAAICVKQTQAVEHDKYADALVMVSAALIHYEGILGFNEFVFVGLSALWVASVLLLCVLRFSVLIAADVPLGQKRFIKDYKARLTHPRRIIEVQEGWAFWRDYIVLAGCLGMAIYDLFLLEHYVIATLIFTCFFSLFRVRRATDVRTLKFLSDIGSASILDKMNEENSVKLVVAGTSNGPCILNLQACKKLNIQHGGAVLCIKGKNGVTIKRTAICCDVTHPSYDDPLVYLSGGDIEPLGLGINDFNITQVSVYISE